MFIFPALEVSLVNLGSILVTATDITESTE